MATTVLRPTAAVLDREVGAGQVAVEDGRVVATGVDVGGDEEMRLDGVLLPGLIDLQVNGAGGRSVDEATPEALDAIAAAVERGGAAAFLPTLITAPLDRLCAQVRAVAEWIESGPQGGAAPLGIHVEGPFLEVSGAHDETLFLDPTPERVDALIEAGRGRIALVTLSPVRRGAVDATARLRAEGIAVALGHANRTEGFEACVDAGARGVTHLFNAMSSFRHRAPGIVGHALDDERVSCALILDGIHVEPIAVRIAYRCLGPDRTIIVTDSVAAAGMPDGDYTFAGMQVTLDEGIVRDLEGTIAGSSLTMQAAVRGFLEMIPGAGPATLARVAAGNPARLIGRDDWGRIEPGAVARFTLLEPDGSLRVVTP